MLEQEENQKEIIDYLLKSKNYPVLHEGVPLFLFEFFIFDMVMPKEVFILIKQPMLILRLLDFPSQTLLGTKQENKFKISFNTGKSCFFEMEIEHFKQALKDEPLYIMLVDVNFGDMKIIASSKLNVSVFAYDQFCQFSGVPPLPRRNVLKLFDNKLNNVCEFDVSLLIRREYFKYKADQEGKLNQDEVFTKSDLKNSHVIDENIISNSKRDHEKEFLSNKPKSIVIENNAITEIERTKNIIHNKSISHHTEVNTYNNQTKPNIKTDLNKSCNIANNKIDSSTNTNNLNKTKTTNNQLKNSVNKNHSNQTNTKSNNFIQQMVDPASKSYAKDLKEFLSGNKNNNPPPLYYYSQKQNQINAMDKRKYENKKKQEEEERIKNINVVISYENNSNTNTNNNTRYNNNNKDNNFRESRESFTKIEKNTSKNYNNNKPNNNIENSKNNNFLNNNSESDYLDAYNRNSNRIVSFINNEKLSKKETNIKERVNHTSYNEFKNQKIKQMENSNSKYFYNPNDKNYEKQMKEVNYYYTNASYKDPNDMEYLKNPNYDEIQKMWMTNMLKKLSSYMTSSTEANFTINKRDNEIKDRDKYLYINTGNTNTNINDYNIHNISAINPRQSDIFRSNDFYIASQKNQTRISGNNQYNRDTGDKFLNKNSLDENEDIEAILNAKFDGSIQQDSDNKTFSPENRKNPSSNLKYNHPFNIKNKKIENKPIMENSESHNKTNSEIVEDLVNIHTQNIVEVAKKNSKSKFSSKHDTKVSSNHNKTYNDTFNKEESIREESRINNKFNNYDYNNDQNDKDNEIEDNDDVPSLTIESRIYNNTKHRVQVNNKTKSPQKRNQNSTYLDNYDDSEIMEDLILSTKHNISKKYTLSNNKNSNSNKKLKESEISESIDMNLIDRSNSPQPLKASNNRNIINTNTYNDTQEILSEDSLNNKIDKTKGNDKFIHVLNRSSNKEFRLKNSSSKKIVNDSICDNYEDFDVLSEKSLRNKFGNKKISMVKTEESQIKEEVNISSGDYYKFDVKDKTIRTNSSAISDDYKNKFDKNDNESQNFENEDPINQNTLSQENNKEKKNNNTTINTDYIQEGTFDEEY